MRRRSRQSRSNVPTRAGGAAMSATSAIVAAASIRHDYLGGSDRSPRRNGARLTGRSTHPNRGGPMANVKPIPDGYPQVTPYLSVDGAGAAIDFYSKVFGATERIRLPGPDGTIGHAELQIGDSIIMLADPFPDGVPTPKQLGGSPVTLSVYVDKVDDVFDRAVKAGATSVRDVENQFYGDRSGQFTDPFGHRWNVSTHVEDVPPDEMEKRAAEAMAAMSG